MMRLTFSHWQLLEQLLTKGCASHCRIRSQMCPSLTTVWGRTRSPVAGHKTVNMWGYPGVMFVWVSHIISKKVLLNLLTSFSLQVLFLHTLRKWPLFHQVTAADNITDECVGRRDDWWESRLKDSLQGLTREPPTVGTSFQRHFRS